MQVDVRDSGLIPGSGRSPGIGHSNPLQYSCLKNPMYRGAWRATIQGVTELDMTKTTEHSHTLTVVQERDQIKEGETFPTVQARGSAAEGLTGLGSVLAFSSVSLLSDCPPVTPAVESSDCLTG